MPTVMQMDIQLKGILVGAVKRDSRDNASTGETYNADGRLFLLTSNEYGEPDIKTIKCSPGMAAQYIPNVLQAEQTAKLSTFPVNFNQWRIEATPTEPKKEGVTLKLIEKKP